MCGEHFRFQSMFPPRRHSSSETVANDGYSAVGDCGRKVDKQNRMGVLMDFEGEKGTLPCFNMGALPSCHSRCFGSKFVAITCKRWQLIPFIPPTCNFFKFSGSFFSRRRIIQKAYHFDITDVSAMAL